MNNLDQFPGVLDAWEAAELPGITILESTGMGNIRQAGLRDDVPLMPNLSDLFRSKEHHHRTLFTVVENEEKVDEIVAISQEILGDLEQPDNGVLFVLPVSRVVGLHGAQARARGD
ncbi:MAG: P-II family nitrogen regulator [Chloroflexota bacterium]